MGRPAGRPGSNAVSRGEESGSSGTVNRIVRHCPHPGRRSIPFLSQSRSPCRYQYPSRFRHPNQHRRRQDSRRSPPRAKSCARDRSRPSRQRSGPAIVSPCSPLLRHRSRPHVPLTHMTRQNPEPMPRTNQSSSSQHPPKWCPRERAIPQLPANERIRPVHEVVKYNFQSAIIYRQLANKKDRPEPRPVSPLRGSVVGVSTRDARGQLLPRHRCRSNSTTSCLSSRTTNRSLTMSQRMSRRQDRARHRPARSCAGFQSRSNIRPPDRSTATRPASRRPRHQIPRHGPTLAMQSPRR